MRAGGADHQLPRVCRAPAGPVAARGVARLRPSRRRAIPRNPRLSDRYRPPRTRTRRILFVSLRLRALGGQELAFFSTIATFGTARDITIAELSIESVFPADKTTSAALHTAFS
jgi:hypothetical protein